MEKPIRDLGKILAPALFKVTNSNSASETVGLYSTYIPNFIQIGLTIWPLAPRTYRHTHRHFSKSTFLDSGDLKDHRIHKISKSIFSGLQYFHYTTYMSESKNRLGDFASSQFSTFWLKDRLLWYNACALLLQISPNVINILAENCWQSWIEIKWLLQTQILNIFFFSYYNTFTILRIWVKVKNIYMRALFIKTLYNWFIYLFYFQSSLFIVYSSCPMATAGT